MPSLSDSWVGRPPVTPQKYANMSAIALGRSTPCGRTAQLPECINFSAYSHARKLNTSQSHAYQLTPWGHINSPPRALKKYQKRTNMNNQKHVGNNCK